MSQIAAPILWITGASSGIGRALAAEWSRRGAAIILSARDERRLAETAAECAGQTITNYGQSAANTQTLPAAAAGLHGQVVIATAGAGAFHLKAGSGDKIYLDGVALDDGDKVSLASPAVGDTFSFAAFQTGASAWDWLVWSNVGALTDGGA